MQIKCSCKTQMDKMDKVLQKETEECEIQQSYVIHERLFSEHFNMHLWLLKEKQNIHLRFK